MRKWRKEHRQKVNGYGKKDRERIKKLVMSKYGNKCCICKFDDIRALCIDHVNGRGTEERQRLTGFRIYGKLAKLPVQKEYQILCANCNLIKAVETGELTVCGPSKFLNRTKSNLKR